jgi:hypothetical protein
VLRCGAGVIQPQDGCGYEHWSCGGILDIALSGTIKPGSPPASAAEHFVEGHTETVLSRAELEEAIAEATATAGR